MVRTAFILGGTGQIGRAAARRLAESGCDVTVASRTAPAADSDVARHVSLDREQRLDLPAEVDVLVDCVAFTRAHAEQLLGLAGRVGSLVVISSASVYADDEGRTLDEATGDDDFPDLPVPIPETQRTVEPGDATYSTRKRAMELALIEQDEIPATIVRPCAIHGPGAKSHAREWFFVKRAADHRPAVFLAYRGESCFHTTSAANLAELIRLAAEQPATRILNCGDPEPPTALEIGRTIAAVLDYRWTEVLLPGRREDRVGWNPWGSPRSLVVDMAAAARELGYRPVTTYEDAVVTTCRWLVDEQPPLDEYMKRFFPYEAEDALLRELARG